MLQQDSLLSVVEIAINMAVEKKSCIRFFVMMEMPWAAGGACCPWEAKNWLSAPN